MPIWSGPGYLRGPLSDLRLLLRLRCPPFENAGVVLMLLVGLPCSSGLLPGAIQRGAEVTPLSPLRV